MKQLLDNQMSQLATSPCNHNGHECIVLSFAFSLTLNYLAANVQYVRHLTTALVAPVK
ncbi:hypothetical protein D1872_299570 [compost metagenome]